VMVDALGTPDLIKAGLRSLLSVKPGLRKDGTPAQLTIKEFNPILSTSSVAKIWYNKLRNLFRSSYEKVPQRYVSPNRRSHDKMLVTDVDDPERSLAMFGGRNISEAYYNIPEGGDETFNDLEILIRNPPGSTSNAMGDRIGLHFSRLFFFLGNRYLTKLLLDPINPRVRFHLSKMTKAQETAMPQGGQVDTLLTKMENEDYLHSGFTDAKSMILNETQNISRNRALTDPDAEGELNSSSIIGQITLRATQAVKTIDLISPYIYFKPEEVRFFHQWLVEDHDRRLRIITNSVGTGDNMPAQAMIDEFVAPQFMLGPSFQDVRAQVLFYAYGKLDGIRYGGTSSYGKLHAKYGVIDNRFSVVTSSNGDPRSRNLNSEVAVFTDSPEIANQLTEGKTKELVDKSYLWGSQEWRALREHPKNSFKMLQERVFGHLIKIFKLMPLI
jgi:putative cardiolipin synthase